MALRMIVTVKQVPDTQNLKGEAMTPEGTVNRGALPAIVNPEDLNALEEALRIKETVDGSIIVLSMGPPSATEALKECFYRGADDLVLLSDKVFAGADTLATSFTLKSAIEKLGDYDLILCGRQAIDGDTAQVGPQLAEKLNINQLTRVTEVLEVTDNPGGFIKVKRSTEYGFEILKSPFPVLLTLTGEANLPRPPDIHRMLGFKDMPFTKDDKKLSGKEIKKKLVSETSHFTIWTNKSLQAEPALCGMSGSPTKVKIIENIVLTANGVKEVQNTDNGIDALIHELKKEHIIG